jgi:hypothetical protein
VSAVLVRFTEHTTLLHCFIADSASRYYNLSFFTLSSDPPDILSRSGPLMSSPFDLLPALRKASFVLRFVPWEVHGTDLLSGGGGEKCFVVVHFIP